MIRDGRELGSRARLLGVALICGSACTFLPPREQLPERLEARAEAIGQEVAALRDLDLRTPVPAGLQREDELRESMRHSIEMEWDAQDDAVERAYKAFGLLPEQLDTKQYLIDFYTGQVAGYYDPETKKFFLKANELATEREDDFAIAHELTHALQDQHFDLKKIHDRFENDEDRALASNALIEGDAMLAGVDHALFRLGAPASASSPLARLLIRTALGSESTPDPESSAEAAELASAPAVIVRQLLFPYAEGALFANAIRSELGEAGLDEVFDDLPDSTEQILYPERYLDRRDRPVTIRLVAPPPGWTSEVEQTLGMLTMQVMLRQHLGAGAESAAEGWDGDRYALWKDESGKQVLVWVSVWDHEGEARRFAERYRELLDKRRSDDHHAVLQRGETVVAIEGQVELVAMADRMFGSTIERAPDDQVPYSLAQRLIRWPLSAGRLSHGFQVGLAGGHLFGLRTSPGGFQVRLLDGVLASSERGPDRTNHSALLGALSTSSDRLHDYRVTQIAGLLHSHRRAQGAQAQSDLRIGWVPPLPGVFSFRRTPTTRELSLFGRPGLRLAWGPGTERGRRVSIAFVRIPFL
jgi:hypothetical protein